MELESYPGSKTTISTLLEHPEFEFKLFRQLGLAAYGAATLEECLIAERRTELGNPAGWVSAWTSVASEVRGQAERAEEKGHLDSASESYLRAANYFQIAEYYALIADLDHTAPGMQCEECFERALSFLPWEGHKVLIGVDDKKIPGYFICADASAAPRPTVMIIGGFESSAEEMYFSHGLSALRRGYNVLLFQGPGQTGALRHDPTSRLRHDYEIPLQVALDFLHDRPEVDRERLALHGSGLGSYFSTRVAAFDPRVKALILNPPFIDMQSILRGMMGPRAMVIDVEARALNELPPSLMRGDVKMLIINMCRRFGVGRLQGLLHATEAYKVSDLLYRIHCPVLSLRSGDGHEELLRQCDMFFSGIRAEDKTEVSFTSIHPTDAHLHFSNLPRLNQAAFDWLDDRFRPV